MSPTQEAFMAEVEALYETFSPLFAARHQGDLWGEVWEAFWEEQTRTSVLRQFHNIKGAAKVLDLASLGRFLHALEELFQSPHIGDILADPSWFERVQDIIAKLQDWAREPLPDEAAADQPPAPHDCEIWQQAMEDALERWLAEHERPRSLSLQLCQAFPGIEQEIYPFLNHEQESGLLALLEAKLPVWVVQAYFSTDAFDEESQALSEALEELGEVVSCTSAGLSAQNEPIFNYLLGCDLELEALTTALADFPLHLLDAREPPALWLVNTTSTQLQTLPPREPLETQQGARARESALDHQEPEHLPTPGPTPLPRAARSPVTTHDLPEIRDALSHITKAYLAGFPDKVEQFRDLVDQLEEEPSDGQLIDEALRFAHSLKGTAGTLGLTPLSRLGASIEELLSAVREADMPLHEECFNYLYAWCDVLEATMLELLDEVSSEHSPAQMQSLVLQRQVQSILERHVAGEASEAAVDQAENVQGQAADEATEPSVSKAALTPSGEEDAPPPSAYGANPLADTAPGLGLPGAPSTLARLKADSVDSLRISLEKIDQLMNAAGELLQGKYAMASFGNALDQVMQAFKRHQALWRQRAQQDVLMLQTSAYDEGALLLASMLPQMEALQSQFEQLEASLGPPIQSLRDSAISMRMVPIKTLFYQFPRMVRQVSRSLHKQVRLHMIGEHTELDKLMIEQLHAPLVHIIRNAVDHGIEAPEARVAAGKPPHGEIVLKAYHQESAVILEITDDGGGIDPDLIGERVVSLGLLSEQELAQASEQRLFSFLFIPGFTTRENATELSGRGVGMDVVKTNVEELQGQIKIYSTLGLGTTILLKLPLTLSITRALVLREGAACYMLPSLSVQEILYVREGEVQETAGGWSMQRHGQCLPLYALSFVLGEPWPQLPFPVQVVVLAGMSRQIGLVVERVEDEEEAMIKPMGSLLQEIPCVAGVATRRRGEIAIVLEPGRLLSRALQMGLPAPSATDEAAAVLHPHRAKRILLAEDAPTSREMFTQLLEYAGFTVVVCRDGLEAWEALQQQSFDLLLTDVDMPGLTGIELLDRVRAHEDLAALPAMVITGQAEEAEITAGLKAGADAYLSKRGFAHMPFLERVCELLGLPMPEGR